MKTFIVAACTMIAAMCCHAETGNTQSVNQTNVSENMSWFSNLLGTGNDAYTKLWEAANAHIDDAKPKSAIEVLTQIEGKARKEKNFAHGLLAKLKLMECRVSLDPEVFVAEIDKLEAEYAACANPVERAVAHALIGSAYNELRGSYYWRLDSEHQAEMDARRDEHFSHLLDDMVALRRAKVADYAVLVEQMKDGEVYGHDMLAVMVDFADKHCKLARRNDPDAHRKAAKVYADCGMREAEAMMLLPVLDEPDELRSLMMRVSDTEVGMDVACEYLPRITVSADSMDRSLCPYDNDFQNTGVATDDEKLRFIRWAKANLQKGKALTNLTTEEDRLLRPVARMNGTNDMIANREAKVSIDFSNVSEVMIEVRKYNGTTAAKNGRKTLRTDGAVVLTNRVTMGNDAVNERRKSQNLPVRGVVETGITLRPGHYVLIVKGAADESVSELSVTSMAVLTAGASTTDKAVYVVDAITGRPLEGATVKGRSYDGTVSETMTTDKRGMAVFKEKMTREVMAVRKGDADDQTAWVYVSAMSQYNKSEPTRQAKIYTDRTIYRPGQVVKGNVLSYAQDGDELSVRAGEKMVLTVHAEDYSFEKKIELTANDMGTADFELQLPDDAKVGEYSLRLQPTNLNGMRGNSTFYASVRVEEYKRPTFEVLFDSKDNAQQTYALGDSIEVTGKAMSFNGVPVQGGKVSCVLECGEVNHWWWRNVDWRQMGTVELTTDSEGKFCVPMCLDSSCLSDKKNGMYRFRVHASVTDQSGETREGTWSVSVSEREYALMIHEKRVLDLDKESQVKVEAINANGDKVSVEGEYALVLAGDTVAQGRFATNAAIDLPRSLAFGQYELCLMSIDGKGNKIEASARFWAVRTNVAATNIKTVGTRDLTTEGMPVSNRQGNDFVYAPDYEVSESKPAELYFAPLRHDSYIYYNVYAGGKIVESSQAVLSNDLHRITVPYRKEWGDGFLVTLMYVRDGETHTMTQTFQYVRPEKELKLSWSTFRDKLQPGASEEWVLNVKDKDGRAVSGAEMMAVMYDAALDRIQQHDWSLVPTFQRCIDNVFANSLRYGSFPHITLMKRMTENRFARQFDYLKQYHHNMYREFKGMAMPRSARLEDASYDGMAMSDAAPMAVAGPERRLSRMVAGNADVVQEVCDEGEIFVANTAGGADDVVFDESALRSNFAETAFFMPHLMSDPAGNVRIAFQLPESLTEWQFRAIVHTKDMDYGKMESKAVARKLFMVRPNMPRFVRWGDEASIVSAIINQSEQPISGVARMRMLNPETGEEVLVMKQPFSVEAGQTTNVDFRFTVLEGYEGMDCEIIATSGDTSDGEKNHLPVLSTKQEMVETVPFYLIDNEEKTLDVSSLFNQNSPTATQRALAIDYTSTPAWMCIEALRSVALPDAENAVSLAAAYHANIRLAEFIDRLPMLAEYENKQTVVANAASARDRLRKLQQSDGGWSWYEGMKSSYYITLSVCEQLARIPSRTAEVSDMLNRGLKYLDKQELTDYNNRKRYNKRDDMMPSSSTLNYLYVSSLLPQRSVDSSVEKMRKEYLGALNGHISDLTIYGVATASCALRAFGFNKAADSFVETLRQFSVTKPGQGRFYATDAAYYSWMDYRIPTQTAAMRAIKAQSDADPYLLDMQLWLITQKQAQKWDNPMNTIDVADLLLAISPDVTFAEATQPSITLDGAAVSDFRTATLNIKRDSLEHRASNLALQGNIVADISAEQIANGVKTMTVKRTETSQISQSQNSNLKTQNSKLNSQNSTLNTPTSISWGFAQATFLEEMGNVKRYATSELSVDRMMYVYRNGKWEKATNGTVLAVGDKVRMRYTVKADRDMDFVCLTAQHPACLEPIEALSGYKFLGTRGGYMAVHDTRIDLSFDWFTRGTATFDIEYYVTRTGTYQIGIATIECAYAKQFGGHTTGGTMKVE